MPEPKFAPKPGQVDYSSVRYTPVVNTLVTDGKKVLLVRRSKKLRLYPDYWNGISGFLDSHQTVEEKVKEELAEELGLSAQDLKSLSRGAPFLQEAPEYNKTWIVVPMLASVRSEKLSLNWEAQAAKWFNTKDIKKLKLLPGFEKVVSEFFPDFL